MKKETGSNANAYFEQQVKSIYGTASEEQIVQRISDCSMVADRLNSDPVWKIVLKDAKGWVDRLDLTWQEIRDPEKLNQARILKTAYLHIASLPNKYKADLITAKREIEIRQNTKTDIIKDYDTE